MHIQLITALLLNFIFSGNVTIPDGITLAVDSDLNGASPQFTLTCISTGGPATTVTWTRDSATAMGDEMTMLDNAETATYIHTVTGRLGGDYQCNVSNNKPSSRLASFTVQGTCTYIHEYVYIALHGARMILHVTYQFPFSSCLSSQ